MRIFTAADVDRLLDYPALIERLRVAFRDGAEVPLRHRHIVPMNDGGTNIMLLKPAWRKGGPVVVKIINIVPNNGARGMAAVLGTALAFDGTTGAPLAVIDGQALTVWRTAATSALAAGYLAREGAATLLVVGTGAVAQRMAEAHACVRAFSRILIWGRARDKAERIADELRLRALPAETAPGLEVAVRAADVISCATLATEPLVRGAWLAPGTHLDLVGSVAPEMREVDDEAMRRARIFLETRDGVLAESGDVIGPLASGAITAASFAGELTDLCRGVVAGRATAAEITAFKSVGHALEDLAAIELLLERG